MLKRSLALLLAVGIAGCESMDFEPTDSHKTTPQQSIQPSPDADRAQTVTPDYDNAELASAKMAGQGTEVDAKLFSIKAASADVLEVKSAELALQQSPNPATKEFAEKLIQHHTQAKKELKSIAARDGVETPDALLPEHQEMYDRLIGLTGLEFDRRFLQNQIQLHQETIRMYEGAANQLVDNELRAYAMERLPMLRQHLKDAQNQWNGL